jgi:tetratricopeptide (TPR) repeat protein/TolB-like protein
MKTFLNKMISANLLINLCLIGSVFAVPSSRTLILPFSNHSGRNAAWFADAMHETMVSRLTGIENVIIFTQDDALRQEILDYSATGKISDEKAYAAGVRLKAHQVFTGNYSIKGKRIEVAARLILVRAEEDTGLGRIEDTTVSTSGADIQVADRDSLQQIFSVEFSGSVDKFHQIQEKIAAGLLAEIGQTETGTGGPVWVVYSEYQSSVDTVQPGPEASGLFMQGLSVHYSNPDSAIHYYHAALERDSNFYSALYFLGILYKHLGKLDQVLEVFYRAERLLVAKKRAESCTYAELMGRIGDTYKKRDKEQALSFYYKSEDILRSLQLDHSANYAEILNEIGHISYSRKQFSEAMKYFEQARVILTELGFQGSLSFSIALHKMGDVYFRKGNMDKALEHYLKSRDIRKVLGRKESYVHAGLLNNIGNGYLGKDELDKAYESYTGSRDVLDTLELKDSKGYALLLNNLGIIERRKGNSDKALEYFFQSEKIFKKIDVQATEEYAQILGNMGVAFFHIWKLDEALKYYLKSLTIRNLLEGDRKTSGYAQVLHGMGMIYMARGKATETLKHFEQAKDILVELKMENTSIYADLLKSMGYMHHVNYQPVAAMEYYKKARDIRSSLKLDKTLDYAHLLQEMGQVYSKHHGKPCLVVPYEKRALLIKEELELSGLETDKKYLARISEECKHGTPTGQFATTKSRLIKKQDDLPVNW